MENPIPKACVEVSMHQPKLLEARIGKIAREKNMDLPGKPLGGSWVYAGTISPECTIEGNLFLGQESIQKRLSYKTHFIFTWLKSNKKSRLAWGMSLS